LNDTVIRFVIAVIYYILLRHYLSILAITGAYKHETNGTKILKRTMLAIGYLLSIYTFLTIVLSIKSTHLIIFNPFLPIILHSAVLTFYWHTFLRPIEDRMDPILRSKMNTNLILGGFCFTSLSFLFTVLKDDVDKYEYAFFFFLTAFGCFLTYYFSLHFRIANLFEYLSEALTD